MIGLAPRAMRGSRHTETLLQPSGTRRDYGLRASLGRSAVDARCPAQVRTFLVSFRELTELAQGKLSPAELANAGSTRAEIQTIGFRSVPLKVEGSLDILGSYAR